MASAGAKAYRKRHAVRMDVEWVRDERWAPRNETRRKRLDVITAIRT